MDRMPSIKHLCILWMLTAIFFFSGWYCYVLRRELNVVNYTVVNVGEQTFFFSQVLFIRALGSAPDGLGEMFVLPVLFSMCLQA